MRNIHFHEHEYYHLYNRGVDKRPIFTDDADRYRFLTGLSKFNQDFVDILAFTLMDNHFHLLVQPKNTTGVAQFMGRVGNGYTKYFNLRHNRTGCLLQGPYQAVHITNDAQLLHISRYIHLNPTAKTGFLEDAMDLYRWTSLSAYLYDHPTFVQTRPILSLFDSTQDYKKFLSEYVYFQPSALESLG